MLSAKPVLLEPIFKVNIEVPREKASSIYTLMAKKRGQVNNVTTQANGVVVELEASLPVAESFGFIDTLWSETSGTAFASMTFEKWSVVPGSPLEEGTLANKVMLEVRKRKGKKVETPKLEDYLDKL